MISSLLIILNSKKISKVRNLNDSQNSLIYYFIGHIFENFIAKKKFFYFFLKILLAKKKRLYIIY